MWFFLALLSALIYSSRGILEKKALINVDKYILGYAVRLFALPFFLIPILFSPELLEPILHPNPNFWFSIIVVSFINAPIETIFYYKALKEEELTTVLPILSFGPAITLIIGSFTLKEIPDFFGLLGILLIVTGIYTIKMKHIRSGILEPFKHLVRNRAIQFMFIVMLSQAVGVVVDKNGVAHSNAFVYALVNYFIISITLFFLVFFKARNHLKQLITHSGSFLLLGFIVATYTLFYLMALQTGFAAYVSAIKNSYILFSVLLGIFLLRETEGKQKIISALIIVAGLIFLKLFS